MRRNRAAFILNATVSVALLGLVAAVALVVKPPSPPGIAEFAPQAAHPITRAPLNQSGTNGAGAGACLAGASCPSASPKPHTPIGTTVRTVIKGVPSALQCYTWPDGSVTQTFDPQSPPCVASWPDADKGNGGATSPGVTASEIRVAYPVPQSSNLSSQATPIVNFFNTHFQLYGRKIVLVPFTSQQSEENFKGTNVGDPTAQHADAIQAANLKVFAATDFVDSNPLSITLPAYPQALAQRKVVSIMGGAGAPNVSDDQLRSYAPYAWTYHETMRTLFLQTAGLVCRTLKDKPAAHSPEYPTTKRSFALVMPTAASNGGQNDGIAPMLAALKACGVAVPPVVYYDSNDNNGSQLSASLAQLRSSGVTSLIFMESSYQNSTSNPLQIADRLRYYPEWVTVGWQSWLTGAMVLLPTRNARAAFGVGNWDKLFPVGQYPWFRAYQAGGEDPSGKSLQSAETLYHELGLLAAGIQMAGPRLTPESFAAGLHGATFPNPGAGATPSFQAGVGFPAGSSAMVHDASAWWIDPSSSAEDVLGGQPNLNPWSVFCYVGRGERGTETTWPKQDRFFKGACR